MKFEVLFNNSKFDGVSKKRLQQSENSPRRSSFDTFQYVIAYVTVLFNNQMSAIKKEI
jgi:hypothetical protein